MKLKISLAVFFLAIIYTQLFAVVENQPSKTIYFKKQIENYEAKSKKKMNIFLKLTIFYSILMAVSFTLERLIMPNTAMLSVYITLGLLFGILAVCTFFVWLIDIIFFKKRQQSS